MGVSSVNKRIRVTFYQRKPRLYNNFSIENYFNSVRLGLPQNIISTIKISKFESNGIFKRLYNIVEAAFYQGDINHITGDVHYLNYFFYRKKTILSIMDCGQLKVLSGFRHKILKYFWFQLPASKSQYITTISTATKQDLLQYINFNPDRIKVIPVCIAADFKKNDKVFNKQRPRILQVGVTANKNIHRLIAALENIPCSLVIIGNVPDDVKKLAEQKKLQLVLFDKPLRLNEVVDQYNQADIITLISTLEGFGMPIVEGNTVGRVVITGNITSMPEVAGDAAHLVDPFSVADMRDGFLKIINDDQYRNKLIENGFENSKRFTNVKIGRQFTDLYEAMLHPSENL